LTSYKGSIYPQESHHGIEILCRGICALQGECPAAQSHTGGLLSTNRWTFQASRSLLPRMDDLFEGVPRFNIFFVLVPPHFQYGSRSCLNNSCTAPDPKSAQNPFLLYLQHFHLATIGARLIPTWCPTRNPLFLPGLRNAVFCFHPFFKPLIPSSSTLSRTTSTCRSQKC
jgi:hypothetical protein